MLGCSWIVLGGGGEPPGALLFWNNPGIRSDHQSGGVSVMHERQETRGSIGLIVIKTVDV